MNIIPSFPVWRVTVYLRQSVPFSLQWLHCITLLCFHTKLRSRYPLHNCPLPTFILLLFPYLDAWAPYQPCPILPKLVTITAKHKYLYLIERQPLIIFLPILFPFIISVFLPNFPKRSSTLVVSMKWPWRSPSSVRQAQSGLLWNASSAEAEPNSSQRVPLRG